MPVRRRQRRNAKSGGRQARHPYPLSLLGTGALAIVAHAAPGLAALTPLRRALLPHLSGCGRPDHVALSFDDGPDPSSTPAFLTALDSLGVKATFFMLGMMVDAAPGLAAEVAAAGHEVGLHGYGHRPHLFMTLPQVRDDLAKGMDSISRATGRAPLLHRPPYGAMSGGTVVASWQLGLRTVLWTAWGRDWRAAATPESVLASLTGRRMAGATLLLHDSDCTSAPGAWRSALGALPELVGRIEEAGLVAGPISDHGVPGRTLPGRGVSATCR